MSTPGSSGRRRTSSSRSYSAEDQALNQIAKEAEGRLAARRAARNEAREIRMRELERQQKEEEKKLDRHADMISDRAGRTYASSTRRGSDEPAEDARGLKKEVAEWEEKYNKAMSTNAQLDNEKQTYRYQVEDMKDQFEELEETWLELQREHKERCRELERWKRDYKDLERDCNFLKEQLAQRDRLIEEHGLVFISNETVEDNDKDKKKIGEPSKKEDGSSSSSAALVTPEAAHILDQAGGSLDERLKKFQQERTQLQEEIKKLKHLLDLEKEKNALSEKYASPNSTSRMNGPDLGLDRQDTQRQISDYKFKLKKAEQDIATLEGNVIRLESQVKRYKSSSETAESGQEELKTEKRRLQRELREAQSEIEELQTSNKHLQKRLDKIKSARSALVNS